MRRTMLTGWWCAIGMSCAAASAITIHVDGKARLGGDGTPGDPYRYLQDGLDRARDDKSVDFIKVAEGTYLPNIDEDGPDPGSDPEHLDEQLESFALVPGVLIEGGYASGFSGGADYWNRETILSGDLDDDDEPNFVNYDDNAYQVVSCEVEKGATLRLYGFTIRGGNAAHKSDDLKMVGGGVMVNANHEDFALDVRHCTIEENQAISGGGGIFLYKADDVKFRHCKIQDNRSLGTDGSYLGGGGVYSWASECWFLHCEIERNSSEYLHGGGFFAVQGWPRVYSCRFARNESAEDGGGFAGSGVGEIINCIFAGNSAGDDGGGIDSAPIVTNCTIVGNTAADRAGGVYNSGDVDNCIIYYNDAVPVVVGLNTIAYSTQYWASVPHYCCVEDWTGNDPNMNATAPQFEDTLGAVDGQGDDDTWGTEDDDVRISRGSTCCEDNGDNTPEPHDAFLEDAEDIDDQGDTEEPIPDRCLFDRIVNSTIDRGALEIPPDDTCPCDIYTGDSECTVNGLDLAQLLSQWTGATEYGCCPKCHNDSDLNFDCRVNGLDLAMLLACWNDCPPGTCGSSPNAEPKRPFSSVALDDYAQFATWVLGGDYVSLWKWFGSLILPKK